MYEIIKRILNHCQPNFLDSLKGRVKTNHRGWDSSPHAWKIEEIT